MGCAKEMKISQGFDVHGKLKFHRNVYKNSRKKMKMSITQMLYEAVA